MFGAVTGDIMAGAFHYEREFTGVPPLGLSSTLNIPISGGGAATDIPLLSFSLPIYTPATGTGSLTGVPTLSLSQTLYVPTSGGGASTDIPLISLTFSPYVPITSVIIDRIPKFYASRNGTTITLTFTNRSDFDVEVYRSDHHNTVLSSQGFVTADTFQQSGLDAKKNYRYVIRLVTRIGGAVNASSRKSTGKWTKA